MVCQKDPDLQSQRGVAVSFVDDNDRGRSSTGTPWLSAVVVEEEVLLSSRRT